MKLDVIIPCYNEEGNITLMHEKLSEALSEIKYNLIFVNDGSKDKTIEKLNDIYKLDPKHVKVINFSRNFGKDAAMYAGLSHSNAEYAVIIDGDLQQNPKYLLEMLNFLETNKDYDQISMINKTRKKENGIIKLLKSMFYNFMNKLSDTHFENGASDFRMFRHSVVESIISLKDQQLIFQLQSQVMNVLKHLEKFLKV